MHQIALAVGRQVAVGECRAKRRLAIDDPLEAEQLVLDLVELVSRSARVIAASTATASSASTRSRGSDQRLRAPNRTSASVGADTFSVSRLSTSLCLRSLPMAGSV